MAKGKVAKDKVSSYMLFKKAIDNGDIEEINKLIEAGEDINASNEQGITPLVHAVIYLNSTMIKALIDAGANIKGCDDVAEGCSSIINDVAIMYGDSTIIEKLLGEDATSS